MTWCHAIAPMKQTSIATSAATVKWSARKMRSIPKVWKFAGPLKATDIVK